MNKTPNIKNKILLNKKNSIKKQTWRLIYPDKTESLTNYDPIEEAEYQGKIKTIVELIRFTNKYKEDFCIALFIKHILKET